jgi:hypothetical protein
VQLPPTVPAGDALRRAVAWLAEQPRWTPALIGEACRRFDLAPLDEEFLLREWRRTRRESGSGSEGAA